MRRSFVAGILLGFVVVVACSLFSRMATVHLLGLAQKNAPYTFTAHVLARVSLFWPRWWEVLTPLILVGCLAAIGLRRRLWSRRASEGGARAESREATVRELRGVDELTVAYRWLLFWFFVSILWPLAPAGLAAAADRINPSEPSVLIIMTSIWYLLLATVSALAFYGFVTARLLGSQAAWLWAVAVLVPLVNVIAVVLLSLKTRRAWVTHGATPGVFGPKRSKEKGSA